MSIRSSHKSASRRTDEEDFSTLGDHMEEQWSVKKKREELAYQMDMVRNYDELRKTHSNTFILTLFPHLKKVVDARREEKRKKREGLASSSDKSSI